MDPATPQVIQLFHYYPSVALAAVGLIVFLLFAVYLFWRITKTKSRKFLYILPITAVMELIGYILRLMSAKNTTLMKYIIMTLFLLLPPNALALVNYKAAGEVIRLSNVPARKFFLKPKFVTWFFFTSDVFAFFLQGGGGGLQAQGDVGMANTGRAITLVGLAVQLGFLACFGFILFIVARDNRYQYHVAGQTNQKQKMIRCLSITLVLLYIRSIYRFAEYAAGFDGPIASAEWAFYVFDTLAIALMFVVYCVMFIGDYLPKRDEVEQLPATRIASTSSLDNLNQAEQGYEMRRDRTKN